MISSEILIRLKKAGVTYIEIPVRHFPRLKGKSTGAGVKVIALALKEFYALRNFI